MRLAQLICLVDQDRYMAVVSRILSHAGVTVVGRPLWISPYVKWDIAYRGAITVGDRCVVSHDVVLLTHDFSLDRVAELKFGRSDREVLFRGPITIGDYAFVGQRAIVLPGVSIGRGSIVGAGSVVTKDVPAGITVAGNPARQISTTDEFWERRHERFVWQDRRYSRATRGRPRSPQNRGDH
jgi:acetyltransferase-like isoleucine patch superfamily enzyme